MKVLHVSPSFYPATSYGGPIYSTYALCNTLAALPEVELRVLTTDTAGLSSSERIGVEEFPVRLPAGYDVYYCGRWLNAEFAPGLFTRLWGMIRWADIVHLTAVYSAPTIPTLLLCRFFRKPIVWSTRGALQRWSKSTRIRTKFIWEKICNSLCQRSRVVLHVTSEAERLASIERIPNARAVVVPNGIDLPGGNANDRAVNGELRLLYLGRLHPIKGIENLLRAMTRLTEDVTLSICGDGEPVYRKHLEAMTVELDLSQRVRFHGHVEGEAKERYFKEADWCVAPSFKEAFCVVVAEALAHGVPVIASKGTPWPEVETVGCGLWVDNDPESLSDAIKRMSKMPRQEMGKKGREWMAREFTWSAIAEKMFKLYEDLCKARS